VREELVSSKWLNTNEDIAHSEVDSCTNVAKMKIIRKYLFKIKVRRDTTPRG
jgi:hypothetical protein